MHSQNIMCRTRHFTPSNTSFPGAVIIFVRVHTADGDFVFLNDIRAFIILSFVILIPGFVFALLAIVAIWASPGVAVAPSVEARGIAFLSFDSLIPWGVGTRGTIFLPFDALIISRDVIALVEVEARIVFLHFHVLILRDIFGLVEVEARIAFLIFVFIFALTLILVLRNFILRNFILSFLSVTRFANGNSVAEICTVMVFFKCGQNPLDRRPFVDIPL
mmetsp:Transcript_16059/g.25449  ORF Transcript_16059/g.25449 Transcript_16059/m.25449 type:complete len:219 (-) Transcript_16059:1656-2312(-)